MTKSLERLINISGQALSRTEAFLPADLFGAFDDIARDLDALLKLKNGFYAFESALHVFASQANENEIGLTDWNSPELWRCKYRDIENDCLFFAEDIFGGQFCIRSDGIYIFEPETGAFSFLASNLDGWAQAILDDYDVLTGYTLAHAWQQSKGNLAAGMRLIPKIPFVLGGEYSIENLYATDSVKGMSSRADLARQIRGAPDGTSISLRVVD